MVTHKENLRKSAVHLDNYIKDFFSSWLLWVGVIILLIGLYLSYSSRPMYLVGIPLIILGFVIILVTEFKVMNYKVRH